MQTVAEMKNVAATTQLASKPRPCSDDPVTAPFWRAASEERLVIQHCAACGKAFHPPVALCMDCASTKLEMRTMSGRGSIYSYTLVHSQRVAAFDALTPFYLARVEIEDAPGVFMITNLVGDWKNAPRIGQSVEVEFEEIAVGVKLPQFRAANALRGEAS